MEVGTQSGEQCNTRYLRVRYGFSGLMVDDNFRNPNVNQKRRRYATLHSCFILYFAVFSSFSIFSLATLYYLLPQFYRIEQAKGIRYCGIIIYYVLTGIFGDCVVYLWKTRICNPCECGGDLPWERCAKRLWYAFTWHGWLWVALVAETAEGWRQEIREGSRVFSASLPELGKSNSSISSRC